VDLARPGDEREKVMVYFRGKQEHMQKFFLRDPCSMPISGRGWKRWMMLTFYAVGKKISPCKDWMRALLNWTPRLGAIFGEQNVFSGFIA